MDKDIEPSIVDEAPQASMDPIDDKESIFSENKSKRSQGSLPEDPEERLKMIHDKIDEEFSKTYDNKTLFWILALMCYCMILVNVDHGSLPGCIEAVEKKLEIQNFGYGILGTVVYTGFMTGSLFGTWVFANSDYNQAVLSLSLTLCSVCLLLFAIQSSYGLALLWRFLTGFGQVAITIFSPWWADTYGSQQVKALSITLFQLCTPLGLFLGYLLTSYMTLYYRWESSFYIQAGLLLPGVIGILVAPKRFLDIDSAIIHRSKIAQRVYEELGVTDLMAQDLNATIPPTKAIGFFPRAAPSLDGEGDAPEEGEEPRRASQRATSSRSNLSQTDIHVAAPAEPYGEVIKILLTNRTFVFLLLSITGYFYIVAGIQNWLPYYVKNVLLIDKPTADEFFLFLTLSAPISGVIAGGAITSLLLGGYNTKGSLALVQYAGYVTAAVILPIPLTTNFQIFGILMWLTLFFGGFSLPALTGIMLNTVEENHRGVAQSIAMFSYNALGYMPAPMVYGVVSSIVDDKDPEEGEGDDAIRPDGTADYRKSRIPMAFLLYSVFLTITFLSFGLKRKFEEHEEFERMTENQEGEQHAPMADEQGTQFNQDDESQPLLNGSKK